MKQYQNTKTNKQNPNSTNQKTSTQTQREARKQNLKPQQTSVTNWSVRGSRCLPLHACSNVGFIPSAEVSPLHRKATGWLRRRRGREQHLLGCSWALRIYRAQWEGTGFCPPTLKEALTIVSIVCFQKLTHSPIFI